MLRTAVDPQQSRGIACVVDRLMSKQRSSAGNQNRIVGTKPTAIVRTSLLDPLFYCHSMLQEYPRNKDVSVKRCCCYEMTCLEENHSKHQFAATAITFGHCGV